jgi:isopentenyl-diphosphate Delta-isomerase
MMCANSGTAPCVILVDEHDNSLGYQEKLRAHLGEGQLHRAFSIFVLDDRDRLLLQRRASGKYHCPGLWANSCCSHPQPGIPLLKGARLRLQEELGFSTPLEKIGAVRYRLPLARGLTEWEFDHLFLGRYAGRVQPDPAEVQDYKWVRIADLAQDILDHTENYAPWLPRILPILLAHLTMPGAAHSVDIASNG